MKQEPGDLRMGMIISNCMWAETMAGQLIGEGSDAGESMVGGMA